MLFKEHYEPLCAYVFGVVKDYDVCEDVVQNLFVKLWIKRKNIPADTSIKAYLYKAAQNAALNQIKHLKIKDKYKQYNKENLDIAKQNFADTMEESELSATIQRAIDKLPKECRKIFLMSRNDGLKYKKIAEELNISIKTVENQMGKALSRLRTDLADYLPAVLIAIIIGIK